MAFLVPSLGSLIKHIWLLLFIPRVAGSLRVLRLPASELNTPFKQPNVNFLSTSTPGLFLDFNIPTNASFVRVYGHKYGGPSLYGVCLGCRGVFEVIDGHKPFLQTPFESAPSCLFSLALVGQESHLLELHNLYDHRFDTHGQITFAFIEYISEDYDGLLAPGGEVSTCRDNLSWSRSKNTLVRRNNVPATTIAPQTSQIPPSRQLGNKMDAMIGMVAALVVIILVIFLISAYYILRLRRQERKLRQLKQDLENKVNPSPPTKSTMISSTTMALGQDSQPRDKVEILSKDRYITDEEETVLWDSTPPPLPPKPDHARVGKPHIQTQATQADTATSPVNRLQPRSRPEPLGPPPREPVPDIPKYPRAAVARPQKDVNRTANSGSTPPARSQGQMDSPSSRLNIGEFSPQDVGRIGENISNLSQSSHSRNQSGTDSSATSHESHSRASPPSSRPLPEQSRDRSLPKSTPLRGLASGNEGRVKLQQLDTKSRHAGGQTHMRTIRELDPGNPSPRLPAQTAPNTLEHIRSASDIQRNTRPRPLPKIQTLRESKSSPGFENGESMGDIQTSVVAQPSRIHTREAPKQTSRPVEPLRTSKASLHPRKDRHSRMEPRISIKIPPDPLDWLTPSTEAPTLPSAAPSASPGNKLPQHTTEGPAGKSEGSHSRRSIAQRPSLPPPQYEQVNSPGRGLSYETPVITPLLVSRKRALPKPPI